MKLIPLFILIPFCAAFLITLSAKWGKVVASVLANLAALSLFILSLFCINLVANHQILVFKIAGISPLLGISLVADALSAFMLVVVNLISFLAMVYAYSYMRRYADAWKFYALSMFMLAGMNGVILNGDLFSLYVFLEIASISAYILVSFGGQAEAIEASFKYAIMGSVASIFILLGIGLIYSYTSTLNMADISSVLATVPQGTLIGFVSILFLAGFGLKAAIVPFHSWLPDAHSSAPSPVSAILSGVFIKTLGVYALCRVFFNVLGFSCNMPMIFMTLGVLSMFVGAILAFAQNDIKRMFAYSSISQVGYIIFALGIGTPLAILGALFHLFNHALFKPLFFLNAGSIEYSTGTRNLSSMGGLNQKLPFIGYTSLFGSLSISGVPPFGGFWSKLIIILAAVNAGYFGFAFLAVAAGILTLVYYVKFQTFAFFGKENDNPLSVKGIPLAMKWPVAFLAAASILTGFLLIGPLRPYLDSAVNVLSSGIAYNDLLLGVFKQ